MFGIELVDAGLATAMLIAAIAGALSFASPCVLPIVPPYLAYMGGVGMAEMQAGETRARRNATISALFFVLGLSTVFLVLGFTASAAGALFLRHQQALSIVAGVMVLVFAAHFLGLFRISFLDREARLDAGDRGGSSFGAYVLGLAFAFGWTPCIGPQLSAILFLAANEASVARGTMLLAVYALGLGIPFLLAAMFITRAMGVMARLKRHMRAIELTSGVLLAVVGLMLITGRYSDFSFWLLENVPFLARLG
ncbi:MAG: sulfite exporter TauE/SafE family protein [Rhodobacteraceae bacterium]|nr:sulfite exporter TauE/SafE family protein [Paracoccaceae bacterium]